MDKHKEVIDSLKSTFADKVNVLEAAQAEGAEALKELDEARASGEDGRVSDASAKLERVGEAIKAAKTEIESVQEQLGWFQEYKDEVALSEKSEAERKEEIKNLFESLSNGSKEKQVRTVGEHFADLLKWRGITRWEDIRKGDKRTSLTIPLTREGLVLDDVKSNKSIKSIYSNYGEVFEDAAEAAVPGFVGMSCGLVEDTTISCLLDPPAEDFEECITQRTLNGNRVRFTYESARTNNAASVLETIYNPYPVFEQDGTKPESTFTLSTAEVRDATIATFITASDRVLEDCGFVAQHIDHVLISNINEEKRRQQIVGSGENGEMLGILNQPNLLERAHQDTDDGGTADDNIYDTFRRGMTDIWFQNGNVDNLCVIMNPRDGEIIDLTKDELGRYLFNDTDCFNRQLRCMRIRYSTNVPEGTAVMGNFTNNWEFWLRKSLNIRVGLTGDQFITNSQTILGEMRGLTLVRCPSKILKITELA